MLKKHGPPRPNHATLSPVRSSRAFEPLPRQEKITKLKKSNLLKDQDPVSKRQVRKIDVVVEKRGAVEGELDLVLLGILTLRQEQPTQVRVVVLKYDKDLFRYQPVLIFFKIFIS